MPSFWNWLCFPQKRLSKQNSRKKLTKDKNRNDDQLSESSSIQKRKLLDIHADLIRVDMDRKYSVNQQNGHQEIQSSRQRLIDGQRPNKRRRVQDIFNLNSEDNDKSVRSGKYSMNETLNSNHLVYSGQTPNSNVQKKTHDFGSGYTPGMYKIKNGNGHNEIESMYGYIPKIVQNVYASTALEGRKIEDFFGQLHRDSSMTHFANMNDNQSSLKSYDNQNSLESSLSSKLSFHPVSSCASIENHDKLSLLDRDENGNQTLMEWNENWHNQVLQAPITQHMTEINFEKIWGNEGDGEVLY